jgi:hypothetical protein
MSFAGRNSMPLASSLAFVADLRPQISDVAEMMSGRQELLMIDEHRAVARCSLLQLVFRVPKTQAVGFLL